MKTIFSTLYGSRLFGCHGPNSDYDYKFVHMESLRDLLFEDVHAINSKDESGEHGKVEEEEFSLNFYFTMLMKGGVVATDMFFSPKEFWNGNYDPGVWNEVLAMRPYVITKNIKGFAGYAKKQSFKYGNKGTKLLTVQKAISLLEKNTPFNDLCEELRGLEGIKYSTEHAAGGDIRHLDICGKDWGETTAYSLWLGPLRVLEESYGDRARLATNGIDLKAQYHTVRIACEAIELLNTGSITFPRPEVSLLLKIRAGDFGEDALRDLVDSKIAEMNACALTSSLPEFPDRDKVKDFIHDMQRRHIVQDTSRGYF